LTKYPQLADPEHEFRVEANLLLISPGNHEWISDSCRFRRHTSDTLVLPSKSSVLGRWLPVQPTMLSNMSSKKNAELSTSQVVSATSQ